MRLFLAIGFILMLHFQTFSWGKTGHRIVGQIAENHLTKRARKSLEKILNGESLAMVSTYMDFIKSDSKYDHMSPWHYCTIPDGETYVEAGTPEEGDIIVTINRLIDELNSKQFTDENEAFAIKCLVHLIGDIHQPLHVGNGEDKGGNDVKLKFFRQNQNLHSIWDAGMIDHENLSFTEYSKLLDNISGDQISKLQASTVLEWANESKDLRPQIYDYPENGGLSWSYIYDHKHILDRRLLEAGIRLAGVLNKIYS